MVISLYTHGITCGMYTVIYTIVTCRGTIRWERMLTKVKFKSPARTPSCCWKQVTPLLTGWGCDSAFSQREAGSRNRWHCGGSPENPSPEKLGLLSGGRGEGAVRNAHRFPGAGPGHTLRGSLGPLSARGQRDQGVISADLYLGF